MAVTTALEQVPSHFSASIYNTNMLQDPRFQKIVSFLFWSSILFLVVLTGLVVAGVILGPEDQLEEDPVVISQPQNNSSAVAPEDVPQSFGAKEKAPPLSLLPNRTPEEINPAPIDPSEELVLLGVAQNFIDTWESFPSPLQASGENYNDKLDPLVTTDGYGSIVNRRDVSTWSDLCPQRPCILGSFPSSRANLVVASYDGKRAYVVGYGVISILPERLRSDDRGGRQYEQSYALLLKREGGRWLVSRAVAETLDAI